MNIDIDEKSGGHLPIEEEAEKRDEVGRAVKQEQKEEAASIYISSDSDSEDVAPGQILHAGGGSDGENRTQNLAETAPVPTTASTRASVWKSTYRNYFDGIPSVGIDSRIPPPSSSSVFQLGTPSTSTQRHSLVASTRLLNTGGFPQPPAASTPAPFSSTSSHPAKGNLAFPPRESAPPITGRTTTPLAFYPTAPLAISGWKIVDTSQGGKLVVCPVCQALLDLNSPGIFHYGASESWSLLEEHMKKHEHCQMSRPCQVCVDRGDLFTRVAPKWLRKHVLSDHKVGRSGPYSVPPPPVISTGNGPVNVPRPVQSKQVDHPGPVPAPDVKFWEFVARPTKTTLVVCPCCQPPENPSKTQLNPENMVSHLQRVHKNASSVQLYKLLDRKCHGCKVVVPPHQLVQHIACQPNLSPKVTTPNEATLKRKAPTDGKSTLNERFGKYKAVQDFSAGRGPIIRFYDPLLR